MSDGRAELFVIIKIARTQGVEEYTSVQLSNVHARRMSNIAVLCIIEQCACAQGVEEYSYLYN